MNVAGSSSIGMRSPSGGSNWWRLKLRVPATTLRPGSQSEVARISFAGAPPAHRRRRHRAPGHRDDKGRNPIESELSAEHVSVELAKAGVVFIMRRERDFHNDAAGFCKALARVGQHSRLSALNIQLQNRYFGLRSDQAVATDFVYLHCANDVPRPSFEFSPDFGARVKQGRSGGMAQLVKRRHAFALGERRIDDLYRGQGAELRAKGPNHSRLAFHQDDARRVKQTEQRLRPTAGMRSRIDARAQI